MALKKVSYTVPNLKTLVNSSNSCVCCIENCSRSLTVLPVHLTDVKRSVNQLLNDKVTTYDSVLRGIILGHKNIKVINHVQLNDDGNFALDYVADIYIFKPEVGNLLAGEVNKKSKDHIGVLVHSFFNVSIPRPRNDTECPKNWIGFDVNIGQSVIFEVVKVDLSGRLPFIKGKLIDSSQCEIDFEDRDSGIGGHESMEENMIMKDQSKIDKDLKKKKKKKKRKSEDIAHLYDNDNLEEQDSVNRNGELLPSEDLIDTLIEKSDNEVNDCSEKKKKKNKRKSEDIAHLYDNDNTEEQDFVNKNGGLVTSDDLIDTLIEKADDEVNECSPEKKKKKKKRKSEGITHIYGYDNAEEQDSACKKEELVTSEDLIDTLIEKANDEVNGCSLENKKMKKKKKVSTVNEYLEAPSTSCTPTKTSKPKKRKFSELDSFQETGPDFSLNIDAIDEIPVPKKKKKKKHSDSNIQ